MITVRIFGGLGNQMFQYAFAKALALDWGAPLRLDISYFEEVNYPFHLHPDYFPFLLDRYHVEEETITGGKWHYANHLRKNRIYSLSNILVEFPGINRHIPYYVKENKHSPRLPHGKKNVYLDGFWQGREEIASIREELLAILKPQQVSVRSIALAEKMGREQSVSIHFRKGDYLSNPRFKAIYADCGVEYYTKAMQLIKARVKSPHYYLFSDNKVWVEQNISTTDNMTFITEDVPDFEQQYLMSCCKHNITANSSFSWWGAWLNKNKERIVISTRNWYRAGKQSVVHTAPYKPASWLEI